MEDSERITVKINMGLRFSPISPAWKLNVLALPEDAKIVIRAFPSL